MNKKTIRIAGWALGLSMAVAGVGLGIASVSSNNAIAVHASSAATFSKNSKVYKTSETAPASNNAGKFGSGKSAGSATISGVASGATSLSFYAAGWNGESVTLKLTTSGSGVKINGKAGSTGDTIDLNSFEEISGSGTSYQFDYTSEDYYTFELSGLASETSFTLAATSGKRFVIWDVVYVDSVAATINGSSTGKAGTAWAVTGITEDVGGATVTGATYSFSAVDEGADPIDISSWTKDTGAGSIIPEEPCTLTVSATKAGYAIANKVVTVSYADVESVTLASYSTTIAKGEPFDADDISVTVNPSSYAEQVWTWTVSDNTVENDYTWNAETNVLKAGDTTGVITLTAASGGKSADFVVTVSAEPILTLNTVSASGYVGGSIEIKPKPSNFAAGEVTYVWSSDDEDVATVSDGTVSLGGVGTATIKAIGYAGGVKQAEAACTVNVIESLNAIDDVDEGTYSYAFPSKQFSAYDTEYELDGANWTAAATGGDYFGYDGTKGQQFGSGSKPAGSLSLTSSDFPGTISSVKVSTSGASSVSATVSVKVGDTSFKSNGNTSQAISATNTKYTFTGTGSGDVVISWTQSSEKALYIKSIEVEYSSVIHYANVVGKEAEQAAVIEFAKSVTNNLNLVCDQINGNTDAAALNTKWGVIKDAFDEQRGSLAPSGKDHFDAMIVKATKNSSGDTLQKALSSYDYVVAKYSAQLDDGDFLHDISKRAAAAHPALSVAGTVSSADNGMPLFVAAIASTGVVAAGGFILVSRKRREQD